MAAEKQSKVSLWSIFLVFLKIGAFTIGGGYAIFPVIRSEVIKRGWVSKEDFPDILALSQTAPGLIAVNMAIFTGYRIRGTKGGVVAALGGILPPFLIILIVAMAFAQFRDNPVIIRIFKGIRPVVVALIAAPMIKMSIETNKTRWWSWLITAASLCLVAFLKISPIYILLTTIVISLAVVIGHDRATRMKNMRDYIKNRNERTGEAGAEGETAKEAGAEGETAKEAGAEGKTVEESGAEGETVEESGAEGETAKEFGAEGKTAETDGPEKEVAEKDGSIGAEAAEAEKTEKPEKKFEGIFQNEGDAEEGGEEEKEGEDAK